jgi:hypothetical protein
LTRTCRPHVLPSARINEVRPCTSREVHPLNEELTHGAQGRGNPSDTDDSSASSRSSHTCRRCKGKCAERTCQTQIHQSPRHRTHSIESSRPRPRRIDSCEQVTRSHRTRIGTDLKCVRPLGDVSILRLHAPRHQIETEIQRRQVVHFDAVVPKHLWGLDRHALPTLVEQLHRALHETDRLTEVEHDRAGGTFESRRGRRRRRLEVGMSRCSGREPEDGNRTRQCKK